MKNLRLLILFVLVIILGTPSLAQAQSPTGNSPVIVEISQDSATLMAGDWVEFSTIIRNEGSTATPPLVAHLNVAAVKRGPYVDPEDWSPRRTRYIDPMQPGETVQLDWRVHTLVKGEFASFVTVVAPESSFIPAASSSLLMQVSPDNILPMNEVVPVVAIVPLFPLGLLLFSSTRNFRLRRRTS